MSWFVLLGFGIDALAEEPAPPDAPDCLASDARLDLIDASATALVEADFERTRAALTQLEDTLRCGSVVPPDLLGRTWLVQGALAVLEGSTPEAVQAFRAAARVAPGSWYEDFGSQLRAVYESALTEPPSTGSLGLDPRPLTYVATIDGYPHTEFPVTLETGLHVVQLGPTSDRVTFGRTVLVEPGDQVIATGLQEVRTVPSASLPTTVASEASTREPWLRIHTGVGAALSVGRGEASSVPTRLSIPVETGLTVRSPGGPWVRLAVLAAPLLTGPLDYTDDVGQTSTPTRLGAHASVGMRAPQGDMGLLVGRSWPLGWSARGVVAGRLPVEVPIGLEGRLGLDIGAGGAPSPSVEFLVTVVPDLSLR